MQPRPRAGVAGVHRSGSFHGPSPVTSGGGVMLAFSPQNLPITASTARGAPESSVKTKR